MIIRKSSLSETNKTVTRIIILNFGKSQMRKYKPHVNIHRINPVNTSTFIFDINVFRLCNNAHIGVNLRSLVLCIEVVFMSCGNVDTIQMHLYQHWSYIMICLPSLANWCLLTLYLYMTTTFSIQQILCQVWMSCC